MGFILVHCSCFMFIFIDQGGYLGLCLLSLVDTYIAVGGSLWIETLLDEASSVNLEPIVRVRSCALGPQTADRRRT